MIKVYVNNMPTMSVKWTILKGEGVKEDLSGSQIFVWLVGKVFRIPLDYVLDDEGKLKVDLPTELPAGVYGIRAMWWKDNQFTDRRRQSEVQNILSVLSEPTTDIQTEDFTFVVKSYVNTSFGLDGLDAYEKAVVTGKTKLTEEEWIESRSLTAVLQTEGENEDASMSQAAITSSLDKIRSLLGSAYKLCGKVTALPKLSEIGDVYYLSSDKHSYGCYGKAEATTGGWTWRANQVKLPPEKTDPFKDKKVGDVFNITLPYAGSTPCGIFAGENGVYNIWMVNDSGAKFGTYPLIYKNNQIQMCSSASDLINAIDGTWTAVVEKGDALYMDLGELETIDYTPKAEDTEYTPPSSGSMFSDESNTQEALDAVGKATPSVELNLATANNTNAEIINANFNALQARYNRLLEILQMLVDNVEFSTPDGFRDISDLISDLSFDQVYSITRVTTGGTYSVSTSISGKAKAGSAISKTI